ncbi:hypothetical protein ElyMa_000719200 [Elysia marginata]|uniref:Uncharacterized protein n=1 Tax=Elysia marginata TaxID=1093978 RepID=A0AAV4GMY4_9GAST|nr:hypothetical protein ElyMa_000719200 [Elysia marginata]
MRLADIFTRSFKSHSSWQHTRRGRSEQDKTGCDENCDASCRIIARVASVDTNSSDKSPQEKLQNLHLVWHKLPHCVYLSLGPGLKKESTSIKIETVTMSRTKQRNYTEPIGQGVDQVRNSGNILN